MRVPGLRLAALALAGAMGLGACASNYPYGYGPSYGYGSYETYGWYGDYYYPGIGVYVYDRNRNRQVWNNDQQRYWADRAARWQGSGRPMNQNENWSGWNRKHHTNPNSPNWKGNKPQTP